MGISRMEGDSYPPPSDMEVGNVAPESMPVKSMVDYSDSNSADVHHQDQEHHGGERQDEMDHQDTPSFSNGNGNGDADEEQSKEMDDNDAPPQEPEKDSFDVFGKMLSSMPAKPADEEEEGGEVKNEDGEEKNEDSEDKKDTFDKMFNSEKPEDDNEDNDDKKDTFEKMFESDSKPEAEENEEKKDDQDEEDAKPSEGTTDFTPNKFGEENISEAFKTLEVYQKALETERARVKKTIEEGMSPDTAVSITRKLRKLYAVTQKNMDLFDRAIVESFVENFPTESTRIHMGRVAPAQPQYAPPVKRGAPKNKKKIKQKIKVKPKGKGKKAPALIPLL